MAATEGQGDVSSKGLGFVLTQEGRPVSSERAACTSIWTRTPSWYLHIWQREYFWTDHKPLVSIISQPLASAPKRLQKLLLRLQSYDVKICYKLSKEIV